MYVYVYVYIYVCVEFFQKDDDNDLGCGSTQNSVTAFLTNIDILLAEKWLLSGTTKQVKWKRIIQKTTADKSFDKCEEPHCFHFC